MLHKSTLLFELGGWLEKKKQAKSESQISGA